MIYQFDLLGRLVASHKSYMDAAKWVQERTSYDVRNPLFGGLEYAAEVIADICRVNDDQQALRWLAYGYWWSTYSFLGDL